MKAILSADRNWGIGYQGKLLIRIPGDMRFFRNTTTGHTIIMGRKTLESMPGGRPLPNRSNIVLTRNPEYAAEGVKIVHSDEELKRVLADTPDDDCFVIGGAEIYRLLLPLCDVVYVTKIDYAYQADAFFPNLDADPEWELTEQSEEQTCFDICYTFCTYRRR